MKLLEERIATDGITVGSDIVKVDMFLNHQIDVDLLEKMGEEFYSLFKDRGVTKILTIEASGIAIACIAARYFKVPVVFAKKGSHKNVGNNVYTSEVFSFTKGISYDIAVSKDYITADDRVLIIDDFLANGKAILGLKSIVDQAGAELLGVGIAVEKGFQPGGNMLREAGIDVESLAIIDSIDNGKITFRA